MYHYTIPLQKKSDGDLLDKEVSTKVDTLLATRAAMNGIRHVFNDERSFDPLYDSIIECMSNTHDHANNSKEGECRWWIYAHNYPNQCRTGYTFIDLGVGIFKSLIVEGYFQQMLKGTPLLKHIDIAPDLISGKIQSRKTKDNEIRGKGIPEIANYAKNEKFTQFYIISNDVKINLKTNECEALGYELNGTMLYWELCN